MGKSISTSRKPPKATDHPNNTLANAKRYAAARFENTYYLGYRDLPLLIDRYVTGKRAVDYGCGTGRSTRFLKDLGFETIGVDISEEMLRHTLNEDAPCHYLHIESGQQNLPLLP